MHAERLTYQLQSAILQGLSKNEHPWDARAFIISLTQSGRDISGRVSEAYESVFQVIKRDIPDEDFPGVFSSNPYQG